MKLARTRCIPLLLLALAACGGGGESGGGAAVVPAPTLPPPTEPTPTPTPSPTPSTAVTFSARSVSLAADNGTSRVTSIDESIGITVANPPATGLAGLWSKVTLSGVPVASGSVRWISASEGKVRLLVRAPSTLGAGTYKSNVKVEVCLDSTCTQPATGSPVDIDVTLVVTGSTWPTTQVYWTKSFVTGAELKTSEVRSPTLTLGISTSDLAYGGLYLRRTATATGLITGMVFSQPSFSPQVGVAFAQYDITLRPPAALGSGFFTDTVQFEACFDAACTAIVPNSRYTLSLDLAIPATEGREFTRRTLPAGTGATEVTWSATNQSLYVATANAADQRVLQVNPVTMATTPSAALTVTDLQHLVVTPDGTYLYAGSRTQPSVLRLQLPALTQGLVVPLGNTTPSWPNLVNDIAPVPGQPQSFVAALKWNTYHAGVVVFDNAVARPASVGVNPAQVFEEARWLVPAATAGKFISLSYGPSQPVVNSFDQLQLDANGISTQGSVPFAGVNQIRYWPRPQRAGSRLYMSDRKILDATSGALLGTVPSRGSLPPYAVLPDEANGRILVWEPASPYDLILSYDISTLKLLAIAEIYSTPVFPPGTGRSMVLWGTEGVALTDGSQLVVLSGAFFSTYRGDPTLVLPPSTPLPPSN